MGQLRLVLRRARTHDYGEVTSLFEATRRWLWTKGTDQWQQPWPNEAVRNLRVWAAMQAGRTWVAWDESVVAATVTVSPNHHGIWPEKYWADPAVYVRRLVVGRSYSGLDLGGQLLRWAGLRAACDYGAHWIRVDVWTTNTALHDYYRDQGFESHGLYERVPRYPSAALFQRPTDRINAPEVSPFREIPLRTPLFREKPPESPLLREILAPGCEQLY
jgi:hypothetical protein